MPSSWVSRDSVDFRAAALSFGVARFLAGGAVFFAAFAGVVFTAAFTAAQRLRCAVAIRSRAAALIFRLTGFLAGSVVV